MKINITAMLVAVVCLMAAMSMALIIGCGDEEIRLALGLSSEPGELMTAPDPQSGDEEIPPSPVPPQPWPVFEDFFADVPAVTNTNRSKVRVFYIGTKTGAEYQDIVTRIQRVVKKVWHFYYDEMSRHGYFTTFSFHKDGLDNPIVTPLQPKHAPQYYLDGGLPALLDKVGYNRPQEIQLFFADFPNAQVKDFCGIGGGRSPSGHAFVVLNSSCNDSRYHRDYLFETTSHELGHAFNLHHDFRSGEYMMSYGQTRLRNGEWDNVVSEPSKISRGAAAWLSRHPAFHERYGSQPYQSIWEFNVVRAEPIPGTDKHEVVITFLTKYFPEGHPSHFLLDYGVLLNTSALRSGTGGQWSEVIQFVDKPNITHTLVRGDMRLYTLRFEAVLPDSLTSVRMEFLSNDGHWESHNSPHPWPH